jgi:hypothetical protein
VCVCVCVIDGDDSGLALEAPADMKHNMQYNTNVNMKQNTNIKDNDVLYQDNPNTEDKERHRIGTLMMEEGRTLTRDEAQTLMMEEARTLLRLYPPMPLNLLGGGGS